MSLLLGLQPVSALVSGIKVVKNRGTVLCFVAYAHVEYEDLP